MLQEGTSSPMLCQARPPPPPPSFLQRHWRALLGAASFAGLIVGVVKGQEKDHLLTMVFSGVGLLALTLVGWRSVQPRPSPPTPLGLDSSAPAAVACGVGGYDALTGAVLGAKGATRGAAQGLEGVPDEELVTIKVAAAGINYADICLRWGLYDSWNQFGGGLRPGQEGPGAKGDVPGFEFSGTVVEVSPGATHNLKVGDEVFGATMFGGYSSRLIVPAHQAGHNAIVPVAPAQQKPVPDVAGLLFAAGATTIGEKALGTLSMELEEPKQPLQEIESNLALNGM